MFGELCHQLALCKPLRSTETVWNPEAHLTLFFCTVPCLRVVQRAVQLYSHFVQPASSGPPRPVCGCLGLLHSAASALSSAPEGLEPPPADAAVSLPASVPQNSAISMRYITVCMSMKTMNPE